MLYYAPSFSILFLSVILIQFVPFLSVPFKWCATYFHEISHGIAALLTGGTIKRIVLKMNGSGLCYTQGGWSFLVTFSGYIGSTLWGMFIYNTTSFLSTEKVKKMAKIFLIMLFLTAFLYARDPITVTVFCVIMTFFYVGLFKFSSRFTRIFLRFLAVFLILDSVVAPLQLIDGRYYGDGASLHRLTGLPEFFWISIWIGFSVFIVLFFWRKNRKILASLI